MAKADEGNISYPGAIGEIAAVLARQQGKEEVDVWDEAMTLYFVRYLDVERDALPPLDEPPNHSR